MERINIVNQALLLLGEKTLQSFDEDTAEARVATVMYETSRDACLREIKPNFAIKRSAVLAAATPPPFEFQYAAGLPQDCALVLSTYDSNAYQLRDWAVEGRMLLSNYAGVRIRYVALHDNVEAIMDASFVKALAAYLAAEFTYTLTNAIGKLASMQLLYEGRKKEAENQYGQESAAQKTQNDELVAVR